MLEEARKISPDLAFEFIYEASPVRIIELLRVNPGSIAANYIGHMNLPADFISQEFISFGSYLAVPIHHRLAGKTALRLSDLAGETVLINYEYVRPEFNDSFANLLKTHRAFMKVADEGLELREITTLVATGSELIYSQGIYRVPIEGYEYVRIEEIEDSRLHLVAMRNFMNEKSEAIFELTRKLRTEIQKIAEAHLNKTYIGIT